MFTFLTNKQTGKSWKVYFNRRGHICAKRFSKKVKFKCIADLFKEFYDKKGILNPTQTGKPCLQNNTPPDYFVYAFASTCHWDNEEFIFFKQPIHSFQANPSPTLPCLNKEVVITEEILKKLPSYIRTFFSDEMCGRQVNLQQFLLLNFFRLASKDNVEPRRWLEEGAGVCRHRAALLGAWLIAFGFDVIYAFCKGHIWLVVNGEDFDPLLSKCPEIGKDLPPNFINEQMKTRCRLCGENVCNCFCDICGDFNNHGTDCFCDEHSISDEICNYCGYVDCICADMDIDPRIFCSFCNEEFDSYRELKRHNCHY